MELSFLKSTIDRKGPDSLQGNRHLVTTVHSSSSQDVGFATTVYTRHYCCLTVTCIAVYVFYEGAENIFETTFHLSLSLSLSLSL